MLLLFSFTMVAQTEKHSRILIHAEEQQIFELAKLGIALEGMNLSRSSSIVLELSQSDIEKVNNAGFQYDILIDDVSKFYVDRNKNASYQIDRSSTDSYPVPDGWEYGDMGGMYTFDQMQAELDTMYQLYPDLITPIQQIGDHVSIEGRPIYWVKISDNPTQNEEEPEVLYTAVHHAREGISLQQMIFFMYHILENYDTDTEIRNIINNTELYFIPVLNPDGYVHNETTNPNGGGMWRKNRRDNGGGNWGVDLNRNYGYEWGYDNSGSSPDPWDDTYRGTAAFSEPETQAIREFCNEHEFKIALNYHSYSDLLLYPWGYTSTTQCPDHDLLNTYAQMMTQDNNYTYGQASTTIYEANGVSDDWMYGEQGEKPMILAYTPEVGGSNDGFWPSISRIIPLCQENVLQNIMAARLVGKYADVNDLSPATIGEVSGYFNFSIKRLGLEQANFTVSIEPLNDAIQEVGDPVVFEGMDVLESITDSISYTLNPNLVAGDEIRYLLKVDNGEVTDADTITKIFGQSIVVFSDNGNAIYNWTGQWNISTSNYHSPTGSITDSPSGNYQSNQTNITSLNIVVDLSDAIFAVLDFWAAWEIEGGYDYVQVEVTTNGGSSWEPLEGNYTKTGNENQAPGEPVYDGFQTEWVRENINLEAYLGEEVRFRFVLVSDAWVTEDGFYFDDLQVSIISSPTSVNEEVASVILSNPQPNPANDVVKFNFNIDEKTSTAIGISIYNSQGAIVFNEILNNNSNEITINISDWTPGVYFYRLNSQGEKGETKKLIVY